MADLIDRAALLKYIDSLSTHWLNSWDTMGVLDAVLKQPTIDAAPVVRCENCRHSSKIANSTKGERHCWSLRGRNNGDGFSRVKRDGFCDEGARMDADAPERAGKGMNNEDQ